MFVLWLQFTKCINAQCRKIKRILLFAWKIFGEKVVILYEWPDYKKRALVKCNDDRLYLAENISWNQYSLLKQLFVKRFFYEIFTASFLSNQKTFLKTFTKSHDTAKLISRNRETLNLISINVCYRTHSSKHQISKNRGPPGGATISTHFLRAKH